jgi:hypothetical protein
VPNNAESNRSARNFVAAKLDATEPIFKDAASTVVPGEVILRLHKDLANRIQSSIPTGPSRRRLLARPTAFGIDSLDEVLGGLQVTSISRLHPPSPVVIDSAKHAANLASAQEGTTSQPFRVRIPGLVVDEEIGLGDVMKQVSYRIGIKPCGEFEKRAVALNRWIVFSPQIVRYLKWERRTASTFA